MIRFTLATGRDDKGYTENYVVYEGGGTTSMKNRKGEAVQKNTVMGGQGTIYIAKGVAENVDEWVLLSKGEYQALTGGVTKESSETPSAKSRRKR